MFMGDSNFNVVIVDDHNMVANLISSNINKFCSKCSCSVFNEADKLFSFLETNKVDFLFLDLFLSGDNGLDILKKCRLNLKNDMKIIILSSCKEPKMISDVIKSGANGFITKNDALDEIEAVLKYLKSNPSKPYLSKNATESLLEEKFNESETKRLSPREEELLTLICKGKTAKEIAYELELSINTIHYYTKRLMLKMGVKRTPDLIIKALRKQN